MSKIEVRFSGEGCICVGPRPIVILTMDEAGNKRAAVEDSELFEAVAKKQNRSFETELPKRVMRTFTESAVMKILAKDEIPNETEDMVLDGNSYSISITMGDVTKEYSANDQSIETYPLLRYLAAWYRKSFLEGFAF